MRAFLTPTIEGSSKLLVKIELCDDLPPYSDIKPRPLDSWVIITSAGLKSSVTTITLLKLLEITPTIKIEISGHTDSDGDDDSNLELSINRAKAVVNWLIDNGIKTSRLTFKGYGETKPLVSNNTVNNKAKNRRTELTIIE